MASQPVSHETSHSYQTVLVAFLGMYYTAWGKQKLGLKI
jgi:hypothetical protein